MNFRLPNTAVSVDQARTYTTESGYQYRPPGSPERQAQDAQQVLNAQSVRDEEAHKRIMRSLFRLGLVAGGAVLGSVLYKKNMRVGGAVGALAGGVVAVGVTLAN